MAHSCPRGEVLVEGEAGELLLEVDLVVVAVDGVMENGIGVGEDMLCGDAVWELLREVIAPRLAVVVVDLLLRPQSVMLLTRSIRLRYSGRGGGIEYHRSQ